MSHVILRYMQLRTLFSIPSALGVAFLIKCIPSENKEATGMRGPSLHHHLFKVAYYSLLTILPRKEKN